VRDDEESRIVFVFRARFLAEFTLSTQGEILPPEAFGGQDDTRRARYDSEGLGMTASRIVFQHPVSFSCQLFALAKLLRSCQE